jgi:putative membrane-bound dehydrogenase-like protein
MIARNCGLSAVLATLAAVAASGQDFPAIYNSEADQQVHPMSAAEAAAGFQMPDGFHVGVFASEPDVQNPIAMTWDWRGRLWVAENFTYAERSQRFDLSLRDRVLIFEDVDGDGAADKRTVFTDQVQMLTSIEVGHGGAWLMCPPRLLFIPDENHDDEPDGTAQLVLDGFDVAKENYHNLANGLRWGPDGWLYGRCGGSCPGRIGKPGTPHDQRVALEGGIWRYHPKTKVFEVLAHGTTNPWGHDWNEFGDGFFINTVNGHLWHLIPGAHLDRPFELDPNPHVYELIDMHADHWHFDTTGSWSKSRDGAANSYGGGHAHMGMSIYLGDNWPDEYRGRLLTFNFHGRRANQELLSLQGSGYVGKHGPDMLIAADPFFRGMDLSYGPDGAVYVIDWSDTGECHESTGVHRTSGRIYRVTHEPDSLPRRDRRDLRSLTSEQLVRFMTHRNEWYVRQARLLLSERSCSDQRDLKTAVRLLMELVLSPDPTTAYRALVTLHAMDVSETQQLKILLSHPDEHLRSWAVRLLTDHWPIDDVFGPTHVSQEMSARITVECDALLQRFCEMAARDASGLVRLTLASTLQRLPVSRRATLAAALVSRDEDAKDHNLPLLVWYGLAPVAKSDPSGLAELATRSTWPRTQRLIARRLAEQIEDRPAAVQKLLAYSASADRDVRRNLLSGISDGLKGWSRAPQPENWSQVVAAIEKDADELTLAMVRDLSVLFGDGRALDEVRQIVQDQDADIGVRRSALQTLVATGDAGVVDICLPLLGDARLNVIACQGVAKSSDPDIARALIENYRRFRAPQRPQVIEVLASRSNFAAELLAAVEAKKIPVSDLTAFDVRQIRSLKDSALQDRVADLWGEVRESSTAKRARIQSLKRQLTAERLQQASPGRGRRLFNDSCFKCHRLFGHGEDIAPDLTGANRDNIDYLLENVVDPSAVVSREFRMTTVVTADGRTLSGLVTAKTAKTLTLQTQTDLRTINLDDIEELERTKQSPMPDGLLDNLPEDQILDLIAYLMQPAQVALPPGAPDKP